MSKSDKKAEWMGQFQDHVTKLAPQHAGKINWDVATYHHSQQRSPQDAATRYVANETPKPERSHADLRDRFHEGNRPTGVVKFGSSKPKGKMMTTSKWKTLADIVQRSQPKKPSVWDKSTWNKSTNEATYKVSNVPKKAKSVVGVTSFGMTAAEKAAKAAKDAEAHAQQNYAAGEKEQRGPKKAEWYKDLGKGLPTTHLKKARETNTHPFVNEVMSRPFKKSSVSSAAAPEPIPAASSYDDLLSSRKAATLAFARRKGIISKNATVESVNYRIHGTAQTYNPTTQAWDVKDHKMTVSAPNSKSALKRSLKQLQVKFPHHHEHEVRLAEGLQCDLTLNAEGRYVAEAIRPNVRLTQLKSSQKPGVIRPNVKLSQIDKEKPLDEAKDHVIHAKPSATKIRNSIIKKYGGKAARSWMQNNPYSAEQHLHVHVPNHKGLHTHLSKHPDWKKKSNVFTSKHGARIVMGNGPDVRVIGRKKSKATTIPYYD